MNWWIVEDALKDRWGHWFEYVRGFRSDLLELGDQVRVLGDRTAEPEVIALTGAEPVLPESIWHRLNDGSSAFLRVLRIVSHARETCRAMARIFAEKAPAPDVVFVPTVLPHHMLAWIWLMKRGRLPSNCRLLLYFVSTPLVWNQSTGSASFPRGLQGPLLFLLLRSVAREVARGRVVLGVETLEMRDALTRASGVLFTYLPQPVQPTIPVRSDASPLTCKPPLFACYGPARHEKGSDLLQQAIKRYLAKAPASNVEFTIHWPNSFLDTWGRSVKPDLQLESDRRVTFIRRYLAPGEYADWLARTDVLLLPYRCSSYGLRGSRVALEAMVNGIPLIVTEQTAPGRQAVQYGAAVLSKDEDVEDICRAISTAVDNLVRLRRLAAERMNVVREHFSVRKFRGLLLVQCDNAGFVAWRT